MLLRPALLLLALAMLAAPVQADAHGDDPCADEAEQDAEKGLRDPSEPASAPMTAEQKGEEFQEAFVGIGDSESGGCAYVTVDPGAADLLEVVELDPDSCLQEAIRKLIDYLDLA